MKKLYYENPYLQEFDARVEGCTPVKNGFAVTLDQTAFYPEGGGQPCDIGTLDCANVTDVQDVDGQIIHTCDCALPVGATVHGKIDWARRFDLMQQHSGEHLVSGVVHARFGYDNVGFHMGSDVITIDFSGILTREQLAAVERTVNEAIWQNLPCEITYLDRNAPVFYRSKKELTGEVRLVRFPGMDLCACCGTHVRQTGEIGLVKLLSCVKFHDGVRVEMLCGKRAYEYLSKIVEQNHRISGLISAKPDQTAQEVERILAEQRQTKYQLVGCQNELLQVKAQALSGRGNVLCFENDLSGDLLRRFADAVMHQCGGICAVLSGSDAAGYHYAIGQLDGDVRALVKSLNAALSGRGGGKPAFAQGAVSATRSEIAAFFAEYGMNVTAQQGANYAG